MSLVCRIVLIDRPELSPNIDLITQFPTKLENTAFIDKSLLASEAYLAYIPGYKFHTESWIINDKFMDHAVNLFTITILNLAEKRYIHIEEETHPRSFLGIDLPSKTKWLVRRVNTVPSGLRIGWLEEQVLGQFHRCSSHYFDKLIYAVFHFILKGKKTYVNPGKNFLLELLGHQQMGLLEYEHKTGLFFSHKVMIIPKKDSAKFSAEVLPTVNPLYPEDAVTRRWRKIIRRQLVKFQDLD